FRQHLPVALVCCVPEGTGRALGRPRKLRCDRRRWLDDKFRRLELIGPRLDTGTPYYGCLHPGARQQPPHLLQTSGQIVQVICPGGLLATSHWWCWLLQRNDLI